MAEKQVMVMALDESDHSFYAFDWILIHFFSSNSTFKLIINATTSSVSAIGLGGPGTTDEPSMVEQDLKSAEKVISRAEDLCTSISVTDVENEVIEGDASNVMCDAVKNFHASVLDLGIHHGTSKWHV